MLHLDINKQGQVVIPTRATQETHGTPANKINKIKKSNESSTDQLRNANEKREFTSTLRKPAPVKAINAEGNFQFGTIDVTKWDNPTESDEHIPENRPTLNNTEGTPMKKQEGPEGVQSPYQKSLMNMYQKDENEQDLIPRIRSQEEMAPMKHLDSTLLGPIQLENKKEKDSS